MQGPTKAIREQGDALAHALFSLLSVPLFLDDHNDLRHAAVLGGCPTTLSLVAAMSAAASRSTVPLWNGARSRSTRCRHPHWHPKQLLGRMVRQGALRHGSRWLLEPRHCSGRPNALVRHVDASILAMLTPQHSPTLASRTHRSGYACHGNALGPQL